MCSEPTPITIISETVITSFKGEKPKLSADWRTEALARSKVVARMSTAVKDVLVPI